MLQTAPLDFNSTIDRLINRIDALNNEAKEASAKYSSIIKQIDERVNVIGCLVLLGFVAFPVFVGIAYGALSLIVTILAVLDGVAIAIGFIWESHKTDTENSLKKNAGDFLQSKEALKQSKEAKLEKKCRNYLNDGQGFTPEKIEFLKRFIVHVPKLIEQLEPAETYSEFIDCFSNKIKDQHVQDYLKTTVTEENKDQLVSTRFNNNNDKYLSDIFDPFFITEIPEGSFEEDFKYFKKEFNKVIEKDLFRPHKMFSYLKRDDNGMPLNEYERRDAHLCPKDDYDEIVNILNTAQ